jgi:anti-sigma factor RsiW
MQDRRRDEIEQLLPGYVSGSLGPGESAAVEQALAADAELRNELRFLQALRDRLLADSRGATVGRMGWHHLQRSLHAAKASPARPRSQWLAAAGLAAAALIVVQSGLLWQAYASRDSYRPLASQQGADLQVRFVAGASAAQISGLLAAERLEIVSGPGAAGVYRLRLTDPAERVEVERMALRLAQYDAVIAFVVRE